MATRYVLSSVFELCAGRLSDTKFSERSCCVLQHVLAQSSIAADNLILSYSMKAVTNMVNHTRTVILVLNISKIVWWQTNDFSKSQKHCHD